jgi:hypothetical protein
VGLAKLYPLNFLCHPQAHFYVWCLVAVFGLWYLWGRGLRWSTLGLFCVINVVRTHFNSQGYTHHGTQLVTLCLLTQCLTAWWYRWRGKKLVLPLRSYAVYYTQGIILISYVASALTKFINSKGLWLYRSKYICAELIKTHKLDYYRELDPLLSAAPAHATWLMQHPFVAQLLFGVGFFLEAFAIVGLHSRFWALLLGVSIIAMHESIDLIMKLHFVNHEWLALIFLVNPLFWCWWLARGKATSQSV